MFIHMYISHLLPHIFIDECLGWFKIMQKTICSKIELLHVINANREILNKNNKCIHNPNDIYYKNIK